jgi:hypothetical protein
MNGKLYMAALLLYASSHSTFCSLSLTSSTAVAERVSAGALLEYAETTDKDSPDQVGDLIRKGASINAEDHQGKTALHYFAQKGFDGCLSLLLRQNTIAFDAPDSQLWTPLHYAAQGGHVSCVRALIQGGALCDTATNAGKIPLELVPEYETLPDEILDVTEAELREMDPKFSRAAECLFLLFRGLVDTRSKNGKVARGRVMLHYAVELLNPEFVKIIRQPVPPFSASFSNAPENREFIHQSAMASSAALHYFVKDNEGMTPLHLLAQKFPDEVAFAIQNVRKDKKNITFSSMRAELVFNRFKIFYEKTNLTKTKLLEDLKEKVPTLPL